MRIIFVLLALFGVWYWWFMPFGVKEMPVPDSLVQQIYTPPFQVETKKPGMVYADGWLDFMAQYQVTARVLARTNYYFWHGAKIAPMDFALGWGPMSLPGIGRRLSVGQGYRTYHYHWGGDGPAIDPQEIILNSANTHLIPANDDIKRRLNAVKGNQIVTLRGYLVYYREDDGFYWHSSLTRGDTGDGSCELLYVEDVQVY